MQLQINWVSALCSLRTVAERDQNDIIANACSALAVRLETLNTVWGIKVDHITPLDRQLLEYAISSRPR